MWVKCVCNWVRTASGRSDRPVMERPVPLTVGELYLQLPGPTRDGKLFVINDDAYCKSYPASLFDLSN